VTNSFGVAVVGAGLIGARRAAVVRETPGCVLRAVADIDIERARRVVEGTDAIASGSWEPVVEDDRVDIVVVATPNNMAMPIVTAAASRGKHVLCEKPLGRNPDEARRMVAAAGGSGVRLKTGFNHRHHPAIARAEAAVRGGAIGEPFFARAVYGHGGRPGYDQEWRGNPEAAGGGELLDQGVHVLDLSRWFLGDFQEVTGYTARWFWNIGPLEDNGFALLRTAGGRIASIHTSWTQWKNQFVFEVFGRDGFVRVDGLGGSYGPERLTLGRRRPESGPPDIQVEEFTGPDNSWRAEWDEFLASIREQREPLANGDDGLKALELVSAVYESSRTGRAVALPA
jgi:predicted dehydrogenase